MLTIFHVHRSFTTSAVHVAKSGKTPRNDKIRSSGVVLVRMVRLLLVTAMSEFSNEWGVFQALERVKCCMASALYTNIVII
jgi:hypothetical protein